MTSVMSIDPAILRLAADNVHGPEFGKATPMGLAIVLVLLAATFLLVRSMNRQIRKVPKTFDADKTDGTDKTDGVPDGADGGAAGDRTDARHPATGGDGAGTDDGGAGGDRPVG